MHDCHLASTRSTDESGGTMSRIAAPLADAIRFSHALRVATISSSEPASVQSVVPACRVLTVRSPPLEFAGRQPPIVVVCGAGFKPGRSRSSPAKPPAASRACWGGRGIGFQPVEFRALRASTRARATHLTGWKPIPLSHEPVFQQAPRAAGEWVSTRSSDRCRSRKLRLALAALRIYTVDSSCAAAMRRFVGSNSFDPRGGLKAALLWPRPVHPTR
jgi:hypothetical protein